MCASGNAAVLTAKLWLDAGLVTDVVVVTSDLSLHAGKRPQLPRPRRGPGRHRRLRDLPALLAVVAWVQHGRGVGRLRAVAAKGGRLRPAARGGHDQRRLPRGVDRPRPRADQALRRRRPGRRRRRGAGHRLPQRPRHRHQTVRRGRDRPARHGGHQRRWPSPRSRSPATARERPRPSSWPAACLAYDHAEIAAPPAAPGAHPRLLDGNCSMRAA